jgi:drug/metabolite transporter (DMT)-like permease
MLDGDNVYVPGFPIGLAESIILVQIGISSICYLAFFAIVRSAGPVFFSQVGYLVTMTGLFWGILVFDESYSVWLWLAVGLIFSGLALVNDGPWSRLRRRPGP